MGRFHNCQLFCTFCVYCLLNKEDLGFRSEINLFLLPFLLLDFWCQFGSKQNNTKNPSIIKMSFYNNTCTSPCFCNVFEKNYTPSSNSKYTIGDLIHQILFQFLLRLNLNASTRKERWRISPPISAHGFGIQTKLAHSLMFIIDQDCVRVCNSFPVSHLWESSATRGWQPESLQRLACLTRCCLCR